ncbi:Uncharacterised protein [uncultured archaeon]|nr:Uncharacterised protein [uncultured archaeon]
MIFQSSALLGLGVIILAWIIQLAYSWKGNRDMKKSFLIIYVIGVALLVIDGYRTNMQDLAIFNLISLVVTMLVLIRMGYKKPVTRSAKPTKRRK